MPHVEPFRGVYYDAERAQTIDALIAPPYDKVSPEQKRLLLARSPYNAVRLELPEREGDENWQQSAAALLRRWFSEGALDRDDEPAYYVYEQTFQLDGKPRSRWGFLGVLRLGGDGAGVAPHEKTFAHVKAERLALLRAAQANLSPIFVIYSDPGGVVRGAFERAAARHLFTARDDDGTIHRLARANDLQLLHTVQQALRHAPAVIADGHHRFETAAAYAAEMRRARPVDPPGMPYNFVMTYFTPIEDDGLVILPAHRALRLPSGRSEADVEQLLAAGWAVEELPSPQAVIAAVQNSRDRIGLVTRTRTALLAPKPDALDNAVDATASEAKRRLPVVALHALLIDPLLDGAELEAHCAFLRSAEEAVALVQRGERDLACLWPAVRPEQVLAIVQQGERMPQKSTDFFPKVATGLMFNVF